MNDLAAIKDRLRQIGVGRPGKPQVRAQNGLAALCEDMVFDDVADLVAEIEQLREASDQLVGENAHMRVELAAKNQEALAAWHERNAVHAHAGRIRWLRRRQEAPLCMTIPPPRFTVPGRDGVKVAELWFIQDPNGSGNVAIDLRLFVPTDSNAADVQFYALDALRQIVADSDNDELGTLDART